MKNIFLAASVLLSSVAFTQNVDKARIKSSKIKTITQTVYTYQYDIATRTMKPSSTGAKFQTITYDQRGNTIEEISYNQNGNVDTKTKYKYDAHDNQIEIAVYGSDGQCQGKNVALYRNDTLRGFQYFDGNGALTGTSYIEYEYSFMPDSNKVESAFVYFGKDSSLAGSEKKIYDRNGRLIDYSMYEDRYLSSRETYEYNPKGWMTKKTNYNRSNDLIAAQTYKYDESGSMIEMQTLGDGWLLKSTVLYKSDAKGNFTEAKKQDGRGEPQELYKYSYVYYL